MHGKWSAPRRSCLSLLYSSLGSRGRVFCDLKNVQRIAKRAALFRIVALAHYVHGTTRGLELDNSCFVHSASMERCCRLGYGDELVLVHLLSLVVGYRLGAYMPEVSPSPTPQQTKIDYGCPVLIASKTHVTGVFSRTITTQFQFLNVFYSLALVKAGKLKTNDGPQLPTHPGCTATDAAPSKTCAWKCRRLPTSNVPSSKAHDSKVRTRVSLQNP